jgi:hypothetical protein
LGAVEAASATTIADSVNDSLSFFVSQPIRTNCRLDNAILVNAMNIEFSIRRNDAERVSGSILFNINCKKRPNYQCR